MNLPIVPHDQVSQVARARSLMASSKPNYMPSTPRACRLKDSFFDSWQELRSVSHLPWQAYVKAGGGRKYGYQEQYNENDFELSPRQLRMGRNRRVVERQLELRASSWGRLKPTTLSMTFAAPKSACARSSHSSAKCCHGSLLPFDSDDITEYRMRCPWLDLEGLMQSRIAGGGGQRGMNGNNSTTAGASPDAGKSTRAVDVSSVGGGRWKALQKLKGGESSPTKQNESPLKQFAGGPRFLVAGPQLDDDDSVDDDEWGEFFSFFHQAASSGDPSPVDDVDENEQQKSVVSPSKMRSSTAANNASALVNQIVSLEGVAARLYGLRSGSPDRGTTGGSCKGGASSPSAKGDGGSSTTPVGSPEQEQRKLHKQRRARRKGVRELHELKEKILNVLQTATPGALLPVDLPGIKAQLAHLGSRGVSAMENAEGAKIVVRDRHLRVFSTDLAEPALLRTTPRARRKRLRPQPPPEVDPTPKSFWATSSEPAEPKSLSTVERIARDVIAEQHRLANLHSRSPGGRKTTRTSPAKAAGLDTSGTTPLMVSGTSKTPKLPEDLSGRAGGGTMDPSSGRAPPKRLRITDARFFDDFQSSDDPEEGASAGGGGGNISYYGTHSFVGAVAPTTETQMRSLTKRLVRDWVDLNSSDTEPPSSDGCGEHLEDLKDILFEEEHRPPRHVLWKMQALESYKEALTKPIMQFKKMSKRRRAMSRLRRSRRVQAGPSDAFQRLTKIKTGSRRLSGSTEGGLSSSPDKKNFVETHHACLASSQPALVTRAMQGEGVDHGSTIGETNTVAGPGPNTGVAASLGEGQRAFPHSLAQMPGVPSKNISGAGNICTGNAISIALGGLMGLSPTIPSSAASSNSTPSPARNALRSQLGNNLAGGGTVGSRRYTNREEGGGMDPNKDSLSGSGTTCLLVAGGKEGDHISYQIEHKEIMVDSSSRAAAPAIAASQVHQGSSGSFVEPLPRGGLLHTTSDSGTIPPGLPAAATTFAGTGAESESPKRIPPAGRGQTTAMEAAAAQRQHTMRGASRGGLASRSVSQSTGSSPEKTVQSKIFRFPAKVLGAACSSEAQQVPPDAVQKALKPLPGATTVTPQAPHPAGHQHHPAGQYVDTDTLSKEHLPTEEELLRRTSSDAGLVGPPPDSREHGGTNGFLQPYSTASAAQRWIWDRQDHPARQMGGTNMSAASLTGGMISADLQHSSQGTFNSRSPDKRFRKKQNATETSAGTARSSTGGLRKLNVRNPLAPIVGTRAIHPGSTASGGGTAPVGSFVAVGAPGGGGSSSSNAPSNSDTVAAGVIEKSLSEREASERLRNLVLNSLTAQQAALQQRSETSSADRPM